MKYAFKNKGKFFLVFLFDFFGYIFFAPLKLFKANPPDPNNILLIRIDHIGDYVNTAPLFRILKQKFPHAKLSVLIHPITKELAERDPNIDEVFVITPFWIEHTLNWRKVWDLILRIRRVRAEK
ncbi:MAG: hypothetical protein NC828_05975, partial [Candidatus Omnitrophica bacterium]|nr:hypothetical protein [Candidatus Omnitrophota bacterium]